MSHDQNCQFHMTKLKTCISPATIPILLLPFRNNQTINVSLRIFNFNGQCVGSLFVARNFSVVSSMVQLVMKLFPELFLCLFFFLREVLKTFT